MRMLSDLCWLSKHPLNLSVIDRIHSWAKAHAFTSGSSESPSETPATESRDAVVPPGQDAQVTGPEGNPPVQAGSSQDNDNEKQPPKPAFLTRVKNGCLRFGHHTKTTLLHSWVNILLIFVPVGIAVEAAHMSPAIIFAMNAVAIVPLAGLLSHATECVASRLGDTVGALINVTFGNAVELIIL